MEKPKSIKGLLTVDGQVVRGQKARVFYIKEELGVLGFVPLPKNLYDSSSIIVCSNRVGVYWYDNQRKEKHLDSFPICKKMVRLLNSDMVSCENGEQRLNNGCD